MAGPQRADQFVPQVPVDLTATLVRLSAVEALAGRAATAAALTLAAGRISTLEAAMATVPQFVDAAAMTVENLLVTYPASAARRGKYVRVTNYGGYVDRVLRCDFDANLNYYYWNPIQAEYGRSMAVIADMTLKRLLSPQSIVLTGSIGVGVTRNVTIDTANGRPGEIIEVRAGLASLLGTLNILGTGLGSAVALAAGGYQKYLIDGSSGALQLIRLV